MKRRDVVHTRQLLVAALMLFDAYVVEELGSAEEVASAPRVIATLLAEVAECLGNKLGRL
jgi:hypothetical protein